MIEQNFSNLTDKILIASPFAMEGNVFHKSLIYVVKHTNEGSIGLIFNRPVNNAPTNNLFEKLDGNIGAGDLKLDIHLGGPVEVKRGFFLHTGEYNKNLLFDSSDKNLAVSSNAQILQDIANGTGPQNSLFIIGYTGWSSGQLEFELENNLWIISEPEHDLIFLKDSEQKWTKALGMLGISKHDFVVPGISTC